MDLEPRISEPAHATGAVEFVDLADLSGDVTFRLREEGDVADLASSMGRLGQLVPLELRLVPGDARFGPRYQIVAGFRRVAALRMLRRERTLARVHTSLSDEDAWGLALSLALLGEPVDRASLDALRARIAIGELPPWAEELIDEALVRSPVEPEVREKFLDFLGQPAGSAGSGPSDDLGLDGEPFSEDERELAALEGGAEEGDETEAAEEEGTVEMTPEELAADLAGRLYEVNQDLAVAHESWTDLPWEGRRGILEQLRWIANLVERLEAGR